MSNSSFYDETNLLFNTSSTEKIVYFYNNDSNSQTPKLNETLFSAAAAGVVTSSSLSSSFNKFKSIKRKLSLLEDDDYDDVNEDYDDLDDDDDIDNYEYMQEFYDETDRHENNNIYNSENSNSKSIEHSSINIDDLFDNDAYFNNIKELELMSLFHLPLLDDSVLAYLNNLNNEQSLTLTDQTTSLITTINIDNSQHNKKKTSNKKRQHVKDEISNPIELPYALDFVKKTFSNDEIKNGIFGDKNNNSKSKTQTPFDAFKTESVKKAIADHYSISDTNIEEVWSRIRPKLNKKLGNLRRTHRFSPKR